MTIQAQLRSKIGKTPLRSVVVWFRHRGLKPNDVFLASYPRSGITWVKFILFEILSGQEAEFNNVSTAIPLLGEQYKALPLLPQRNRLIGTHEVWRTEYKKVIYLVRDAKDVALAEYAFHKWKELERKDFDDYLMKFLLGKSHGFGFPSWVEHVNSWLGATNVLGGNILIVKYEDLRQNTEVMIAKMLSFLDVTVNKDTIRNAIENNSIEKMRAKEDKVKDTFFRDRRKTYSDDLRFIRKGQVGGWRESLNEIQVQRINKYAGQTLSLLGYPLQHEDEK